MSPGMLDTVSVVAEEPEAGFPVVSRIPGTGTIKFLDYFAALTAADRDSLLNSLAPSVPCDTFRARGARFHADVRRYRSRAAPPAKAMLTDRMSVEMMAKTRAALDFTPRDDAPAVLVPDSDPAHLKPTRAPQLTILLDRTFSELFGPGNQKLPGGEIVHLGAWEGTGLTVRIDLVAMESQIVPTTPDAHKIFLSEPGINPPVGELVVQTVRLCNSVIALV